MADLGSSKVYGDLTVSRNLSVLGAVSGDGSGLTGTATLRATGTTKDDVGLSGIPNTNGSTSNYLRGDGSWVTPPNTNTWRGIDDTPVNGETSQSISSNWAYDHVNSSTAHPRDTRNQIAGTYNTVIGTDTDINTSGATIIDNLYMTDGVITSHGTRALTKSDIGLGNVENTSASESTTASTIAKRNSSGDIYARLFRSTYSNQSTISGGIAYRVNTTDNYIRFCNDPAAIRSFIGAQASGSYASASHDHNGDTIYPNELYLGDNGSADSNMFFYDDNSNTWRTFQWNDSISEWRVEDNGGSMRRLFHEGHLPTWSEVASKPSTFTPSAHNHNGDTLYPVHIHLDSAIYHAGDTNTYMQFHTTDQWRVVTAGAEQIEVSNNLLWVRGSLRADSDVIAYYSDERLKNIEGTIDNPIDKVSKLSGFYYKENELAKSFGYDNPNRQVGVSAQEVEKIMPEAVHLASFDFDKDEDGNEYSVSGENYKTVQYEKLVPLLIEAIKEQQKEIDILKSKIY